MWIVQICVAAFWYSIGVYLLFREATVWETARQFGWFRRHFRSGSCRKWERFCRDAGLLCFAVGCLLFFKLPFGMGLFGVIIALPLLAFLL